MHFTLLVLHTLWIHTSHRLPSFLALSERVVDLTTQIRLFSTTTSSTTTTVNNTIEEDGSKIALLSESIAALEQQALKLAVQLSLPKSGI